MRDTKNTLYFKLLAIFQHFTQQHISKSTNSNVKLSSYFYLIQRTIGISTRRKLRIGTNSTYSCSNLNIFGENSTHWNLRELRLSYLPEFMSKKAYWLHFESQLGIFYNFMSFFIFLGYHFWIYNLPSEIPN